MRSAFGSISVAKPSSTSAVRIVAGGSCVRKLDRRRNENIAVLLSWDAVQPSKALRADAVAGRLSRGVRFREACPLAWRAAHGSAPQSVFVLGDGVPALTGPILAVVRRELLRDWSNE